MVKIMKGMQWKWQKAAEQELWLMVGIGTPEGAPIPESKNSSNFKTDNEGNVVVSRLNEQM